MSPEFIRSRIRALLSASFCDRISSTFLIGSWTTGEVNVSKYASDIDAVCVVPDDYSELQCVEVGQALRSVLMSDGYLNRFSIGVRCRRRNELSRFSRYLALHGYHSSYAQLIGELRDPADLLPPFEPSLPSKDELLCVLLESLWGEIRSLASAFNLTAKRSFFAAKALLAYVTVYLVSKGIFLPTHESRVKRLLDEVRLESPAGFTAALLVKRGQVAMESDVALIAGSTRFLRSVLCERVVNFDTDILSDFDPGLFWISKRRGLTVSSRRSIAESLCVALERILSFSDDTDASDIYTFDLHGWQSVISWPPLRYLFGAQPVISRKDFANSVHDFRIRESVAAFRDWGYASALPKTE